MGNKIKIFDVDDTLVVTKSKIKVYDTKTRKWFSLTPQDFNHYKTEPHHKLDYSDFRDLEILKAGKTIDWVFEILRRAVKKGTPVGVITARDDKDIICEFLSHNDVHINCNYIYAINDPDLGFTGSTAEKKKQAFERFVNMGFTNFEFYDDDAENIRLANQLAKEDPTIKMKAKLIKQKWIPRFDDFS
mgnify:FL=1|tara:strand:- start:1114 stop:1677 length:564 start_codon:yes stop_codon:yes gene_type:complete